MEKGFTLVELLGVIVVLSIIGLITTISINKTLEKNKEKVIMVDTKQVEKAAEDCVADYIAKKYTGNVNTGCKPPETGSKNIDVSYLVSNGYLDISKNENIKSGYVKVTINGNSLSYEYNN